MEDEVSRDYYIVVLTVENENDVVRRTRVLHAAMYRILDTRGVRLRRVIAADHEGGCMTMEIEAPEADPSIVPGSVTARFYRKDDCPAAVARGGG